MNLLLAYGSRSRRFSVVLAVFAMVWGGCGSASPFASLRLANQSSGNTTGPLGGGSTGSGLFPIGGGGTPNPSGDTSCTLTGSRQNIAVNLKNESSQAVAYRMMFVASAGAGGFVCDSDTARYTAAGYQNKGASFTVGCVQLTPSTSGLRGGTTLLVLSVGRDQSGNYQLIASNVGGQPQTAPSAGAPVNGITQIPTPEIILLGDDDPTDTLFICQGSDLCSQGGFTYVVPPVTQGATPTQIDDTTAQTTQGTLCNASSSFAAPEWQLHDTTQTDSSASAFEYVAGSTITITVLNRVFAASGQNQVVWSVVGPLPDLTQVHTEQR